MNIQRLEELLPEIEGLAKIHNYIRIKALLRHECQIAKIENALLNDLTARELMFGLRMLVAEAKLKEIENFDAFVSGETLDKFTKTELTKMKKDDLIEIVLAFQDPSYEPRSDSDDSDVSE